MLVKEDFLIDVFEFQRVLTSSIDLSEVQRAHTCQGEEWDGSDMRKESQIVQT
jgi:hypothetical protein